jgi:hypothetical protein
MGSVNWSGSAGRGGNIAASGNNGRIFIEW